MMVGKEQTVEGDLFIRRCVLCGYDGELLRDGRARTCASCGADLRKRPARSYAEMEGLARPPLTLNTLLFDHGTGFRGAAQRWLSFLFLVVVGLLLVVYLVAAALP